jgi:hypothetical protein
MIRKPLVIIYLVIFLVCLCTYVTWSANQKHNLDKSVTPEAKQKSIKDSLRSMATGFEAYFIDYNTYPQNLAQLTTPISYLIRIPEEPYGGNWIISFSDDSIYIAIQSSTHPDNKRIFINGVKLQSYSEDKLINIILNEKEAELRLHARYALSTKIAALDKSNKHEEEHSLAKYFVDQTLTNKDTTIRMHAAEAVKYFAEYYPDISGYITALISKLNDKEPGMRIAACHAISLTQIATYKPSQH